MNTSKTIYNFILGHISSDTFGGFNHPSNIMFEGSADEAFKAFKADPEAYDVGQTKCHFKEAARTGCCDLGCGLVLQARMDWRKTVAVRMG